MSILTVWSATGGTHSWNDVKTLGIKNVRAIILKFIFSSEGRGCQFVGDAGAN